MTPPRAARWARKLYRVALLLLPRDFRTRQAESLQAFFDEDIRDVHAARGAGGVVLRTAAALRDIMHTTAAERLRSAGERAGALRAMPREARAAGRGLRRTPAFAVGVATTILLAAGVGTAWTSLAYQGMLAPLPVADADRLVHVAVQTLPGEPALPASYPEYREWRDGARTLTGLAAFSPTNRTLVGLGAPTRIAAALVTPGFFSTLGVAMAEGREFRPDEQPAGADGVAVITHDFRARHFSADADVIGRAITLGGRQFDIVGVLPTGFRLDLQPADVFVPLGLRPVDLQRRDSRWLTVIGRRADGAALDRVTADLTAIAAAQPSASGEPGPRPVVMSLRRAIVGDAARTYGLLGGATLLVALAAVVSLAALAVARVSARRRELAVRAALGASTTALMMSVAIEFVILGLGGGLAAAVAGTWMAHAAATAVPGIVAAGVRPSAPLAVVLVVSGMLTVAAILPALAGAALHLRQHAAAGALASGRSLPPSSRLGTGLVAAQVALALVLLVGMGLMARSLDHLLARDPGFAADRLLAMSLSLPAERYPDAASVSSFYDDVIRRVSELPGVEGAALVDEMPFTKDDGLVELGVEGDAIGPTMAAIRSVSPTYFGTLALPFEAGRTFGPADTLDGDPVAVISVSLAQRLFPGGTAVGRRLALTRSTGRFEVVGVVGDVRLGEVDREFAPTVYTSSRQDPSRSAQLVVRTDADASAMSGGVRTVLADLDREVPVYDVRSFADARNATRAMVTRRAIFIPLMAFGLLGTGIAAIGVYALMLGATAARTAEFGVRLALGASGSGIRRLAFADGIRPALVGVAVGMPVAALAVQLLRGLLFETRPLDPVAFLGAAAALLAVAGLAAAGPAIRCSRLDPLRALRANDAR